MTCIVALRASDGAVWMGADSSAQRMGTLISLPEEQGKVVRVGPVLFGVSGMQAVIAHLRHAFTAPTLGEDADPFEWLLRDFGPALREHLKDADVYLADADSEGTPKGISGNAIVAVRGRIFELDQVLNPTEVGGQYHACGSGEDSALGALYALTAWAPYIVPEQMVEIALEAASTHREGCRGPYVILSTPPAPPRIRHLQPAHPSASVTVEQAAEAARKAAGE